ncbi:hypothetical protein [Gimesia algae]|uniref:MraY-like glycosyltransferase n=1 Tax=Gimesia algae TaxID=2527971 RepID=A0A517VGP4_9PLAN|nr:hypothetical protein [Gimesia algae]QDT92188.1 hypothetical protein Pan161_38550 [Gimesia algae]
MTEPVQLSEPEKASLQRILSIDNLESQKRIAYPFWALAGFTFVISQVALLWNPLFCITLLPIAFAMLMIGMARIGYYRLYRLIHYQNAVTDKSVNKLS